MDKIKRNAEAFANLLNAEYLMYLSYRGKGFEVRLRFSKSNFHHLEGFGQAKDLTDIYSESGNKTFDMALNGEISDNLLEKSKYFYTDCINKKMDYLYLLEKALDENEMVFRLCKDASGRTKIVAELMLQTETDGNTICVYIDRCSKRLSDYYCKSFIANPEFDRTKGHKKITLLWKEKKNLLDADFSEVQYQYNDFTPDMLNQDSL